MTNISVTDHALVRWLERVHKLDMEAFRQQIRERVADAVKAGASRLKADGVEYVITDHVVVSVIPRACKRAKCRNKLSPDELDIDPQDTE